MLPWFVLGFLLLAGCVSARLGWCQMSWRSHLAALGAWLTRILAAVSGLGLGVRLATVRTAGLRVSIAVVISLVLLSD